MELTRSLRGSRLAAVAVPTAAVRWRRGGSWARPGRSGGGAAIQRLEYIAESRDQCKTPLPSHTFLLSSLTALYAAAASDLRRRRSWPRPAALHLQVPLGESHLPLALLQSSLPEGPSSSPLDL